jgi:ribosomal protein L21E
MEFVRITSEGNVGIGETSPTYKLEVRGSGTNTLQRWTTTEGGALLLIPGDDAANPDWTFIAGTNEDIQIDPANNNSGLIVKYNGNVGIGTDVPAAKLTIKGSDSINAFKITDSGDGDGFKVTSHTTQGTYVQIYNAAHTQTIMLDGRSDSTVRHSYFNGGGNVGIGTTSPGFKFVVQDDGTDQIIADFRDSNSVYGLLLSSTGTGGKIEGRGTNHDLTINTSGTGDITLIPGGNVGIGTSAPDVKFHVTTSEDGSGIDKGTAKFINTNTGQGATTMHMVQTSSSAYANAVKFWQGSTPTAVGFIRLTTSATQFITSASDLNLKKNITTWGDDTLSKFKALEPKKFRFKTQDTSEDKTLGFIAQNEVGNFPEAYPQFLGEDEKPYYGFNPTGMVPHLMKAIKDLVEKVETLENKITQLENNN